MKLLLVEDNIKLAELVTEALGGAGFAMDYVGTSGDAKASLMATRYSGIILDLGLPDEDGLNVLSFLRNRADSTPVLILTARDGLDDRVKGLNSGADDYVLKPFEMKELIARMKALLRRPGNALGTVLNLGNVEFNTNSRQVAISGEIITFSRRELDVLELLLRRSHNVVTKSMLEEELYGFNEEVSSNSIEVAIHRLRKSLNDAKANLYIHTLRGVGYILSDTSTSDK
ncbi:MAG: response regulator transcription factor [Rhodospirillales bacterium]|jgi:DNA-binding response OmpR family regulator|nr:response regulator transcription factor [Rhodospirillales bacterium]